MRFEYGNSRNRNRLICITPQRRSYFFKLFRRRKTSGNLRPGAMPPEKLKEQIRQFGEGAVVELLRIGFDGQVDDIPMIVQILNIGEESFTGRIVNVERAMIEKNTQTKVYARRGGGVIEFFYSDGDVKEVLENRDMDDLSEARDVPAIQEILAALELDDRILVAYYDRKHQGTVNVEGLLKSKSADHSGFTLAIDKINGVSLDNRLEKNFRIDADLVIDISLV